MARIVVTAWIVLILTLSIVSHAKAKEITDHGSVIDSWPIVCDTYDCGRMWVQTTFFGQHIFMFENCSHYQNRYYCKPNRIK